jgi:Domain of unknown function (DUF1996)
MPWYFRSLRRRCGGSSLVVVAVIVVALLMLGIVGVQSSAESGPRSLLGAVSAETNAGATQTTQADATRRVSPELGAAQRRAYAPRWWRHLHRRKPNPAAPAAPPASPAAPPASTMPPMTSPTSPILGSDSMVSDSMVSDSLGSDSLGSVTASTGLASTAPPATASTAPATMPMPQPSVPAAALRPNAFRVTMGSGRSTPFDNSSPPGDESRHGTRSYCVVSHFSHDDPIVHPGQQGAAHAHMFWGNTSSDYTSTGASLARTGNSSCEGGITNRSSYWMPALFNDADEAVLPESVFVYYKSFGGPGFDRSTIRPIPAGLEMLASGTVANSGEWAFKLSGSATEVDLMVLFPTCLQVDGSGAPVLSSPDHVSHLSYQYGSGPSNCPPSHPYRIPQVIYSVHYAVPIDSAWSLSSDHSGMAKGASLHADYVAGWDPATMLQVVECNIVARGNCGFAGDRGQLPERFVGPDGKAIYQASVLLTDGADRTPFGTALTRFAR